MTRITRIDPDRMNFGWDPAQRVSKVTEALAEQRAHRRAAPSGSIDEDIAARNVADLEQTLARAETNAEAGRRQAQALEAAETAKQKEHDDRALAVITGQLQRDFMAQPGATLTEFNEMLPELLRENRKAAARNAPAVFAEQLAEAKRRLGPAF